MKSFRLVGIVGVVLYVLTTPSYACPNCQCALPEVEQVNCFNAQGCHDVISHYIPGDMASCVLFGADTQIPCCGTNYINFHRNLGQCGSASISGESLIPDDPPILSAALCGSDETSLSKSVSSTAIAR